MVDVVTQTSMALIPRSPSRTALVTILTITPESSHFSEFKFMDYQVRTNAGGSSSSDLNLNDSNDRLSMGYGSTKGDVSWTATHPFANSPDSLATTIVMTALHLENDIHSLGSFETAFRIGWGENGQDEGWYPW